MGDPSGIGAEIILKAMPELIDRSIVYGSFALLDHYNQVFCYNYDLNLIEDASQAQKDKVNILDPSGLKLDEFEIGKLSTASGKSAYLYLERACNDAMEGKVKGLVTCPLNKEALHMAGYQVAGHTEILANLTSTSSYAMLLWSDNIKTIHVSTHVSLKEAISRVRKERIMEVTTLANETLKKAGYHSPRIAVAGLNPHAGENGLFGDEEINEILPAVEELKKMQIDVNGPVAPDTVFLRCYKGEFDLVVAMYHDQGHIPLKLLNFDGGVNLTVGLPIIRTSVDHGTAFDIAGKNIAHPDSLIQAFHLAEKLYRS